MHLPARRMIPWEALRVTRETGFAPLPGQERAWLIRRVLLAGRFFRIAGPDDDRFVEIETGAEIPVGPDGQTPAGAFAIIFDNRGRQTDRTIELQGRGAPPRPQNRQGELP